MADSCLSILFLKEKSLPSDPYDEAFSKFKDEDSRRFETSFIPVTKSEPHVNGVQSLTELLCRGSIGRRPDSIFGGLVFTSQRAVSIFAAAVTELIAQNEGEYGPYQAVSSMNP
jgi:uroporphyrinogen-III synthase